MSTPNPTRELAPAYDPSIVERPWYERWESRGVFRADDLALYEAKLEATLTPECAAWLERGGAVS